MTRIVVLGGIRSGKTSHAARLAMRTARPVVVVATAEVTDAEFADRVSAHRARRPADWRTVETADLSGALADAATDATVVVDALDTWLARQMGAAGLWTEAAVAPLDGRERASRDAILADLAAFWAAAGRRPGTTIVVAGQPGCAPVPADASTRRYLDAHGEALQLLAAAADRVELVIAGRPLDLVDELGRGSSPPTPPGQGWVPPALRDHGDRQAPPGTLDLAVNVLDGPPPWLRDRLAVACGRLAAYPDDRAARTAAASRHGRPPGECLLLHGAAEAFWLLAAARRPRLSACVHPSFTEPEAALRAHGHPVVRVFRDAERGWRLDPHDVPDEAELVVLGRPDNPTGVVDPPATFEALARPDRLLVVDEAFAELLPHDPDGLAARRDLPGLVVVRSLTKLWGLAGLRVGYLVGPADLVARLDSRRQPWPINALAVEALLHCLAAEDERADRARRTAREREALIADLRAIAGLMLWPSAANFLLLRAAGVDDLHQRLLDRGVAARRADTFPGLGPDHVRVAVRDRAASGQLVAALRDALADRVRELAAGVQPADVHESA